MIQLGMIAIGLLMLAGSPADAELWCLRGPGQQPDHACDGDGAKIDTVAATYQDQWTTQYPGVSRVIGAISDSYDYMELRVLVEPPELAPSIAAVLPTEADGFPVRVISYPPQPEVESIGGDGGYQSTSSAIQSDADHDSLARAMDDDETKAWENLPGVIAIGWKDPESSSDHPKIVIEVQPSMMESVRKETPTSKLGIPIVVENGIATNIN